MSNSARPPDFSAAIAKIKQSYIDRLPEEYNRIEAALARLRENNSDIEALEVLRQLFHKISGSSGSFGLKQLGINAKKAEDLIQNWRQNELLEKPEITTIKTSLIDSLVSQFQQVKKVSQIDEPQSMLQASVFHQPQKAFINSLWLIEDDEILAQELLRQFQTFGYQTESFSDLKSADEKAAHHTPGALLVDVMFDKDQINATEEFAKTKYLSALKCPILFTSAYDDFESRIRAVQLNAKGYFLKPISVPAIVNHLKRLVNTEDLPDAKILIVDDDEALTEHFNCVLQSAGFSVKTLNDPANIITVISEFNPEVILLDLEMPHYTGIQIAGVIRQYEKWISLPILYLSAVTDVKTQSLALEQGAEEFLTKPISDLQLIATLRARVIRSRQLDEQISRDGLTGLLKHAVIKESVNQAIIASHRGKKPCCIVMLDIDHFKLVNDQYGHAIGDVVISSIALALQQRLRVSDVIGRYGGEEFVAILHECEAKRACEIIDLIRESFSQIEFAYKEHKFNCTFSAGLVCSSDMSGSNGEQILIAADTCLYESKTNGRNQVTFYTQTEQ